MNFHYPNAQFYIPDAAAVPDALSRVTHLGIGAHQDDLEFMAFHGILSCYESATEWFCGVTCTDGSGSARSGKYAAFTDEKMRAIRREEQNLAAQIGRYAAMVQLDFPSSRVKNGHDTALRDDLITLLEATRPRVVYTHNPADKHDSHIGVCVAAIDAMRTLPAEWRPQVVYGCEVWRDLDWMPDAEKIVLNVSGQGALAEALNEVFDSQIAGGKRYDLAVMGRRRANATFLNAHALDDSDGVSFAMDLTPLVADPAMDIVDFVCGSIERFKSDVREKLKIQLGQI